jgi:Icc-related predicted phosphoesterase
MKVLFTSDLHGEIDLYHELLELAHSSSAEILILGGDLLPSFSPTKQYEEMLPNQKTFAHEFLIPFFRRINETTGVKEVLLIPGNWDMGYSYLFKEPVEGIVDLNQKSYPLKDGYELIGYPFVPPTPFRPKDFEKRDDPEAPWPPQKNPSYIRASDQTDRLVIVDPHLYLRQRETIREDLAKLQKPLDLRRTIYVMHSPPSGTTLDLIQGGRHAGSRSITSFIGENQPLLTLHGHIHESPELSGKYHNRMGHTLSVNPGQFSLRGEGGPRLHAVTFDLENPGGTLWHTCLS